jgi:hypothetical protein
VVEAPGLVLTCRATAPRWGQCAGRTERGALLDHGSDASPCHQGASAAILEDAWTPIKYTHPGLDDDAQAWSSDVEVVEIRFTASSKVKAERVTARPIVRRAPDSNPAPQNR